MKFRTPLIALAMLLLAGEARSQSHWTPLTSGTTLHLRDVFFVSADTGFVVGDDSLLLYTANGGNTWTPLPPAPSFSPGNMKAIWMQSHLNGFFAPEFLDAMHKTTNGGLSWSVDPSSPGNPCYPDGLWFDGPNEGFIYGRGCFGGAYISRYNGSAWGIDQQLYYGVSPNFGPLGLHGFTKDTVNGVYVTVGDYGLMMRSTDAFQTWDTLAPPITDSLNFSAVDYASNGKFYAVSDSTLSNILVSYDDGLTFVEDTSYQLTFFYPAFDDVDMHGDAFGIAVGRGYVSSGLVCERHGTSWRYPEALAQPQHAVFVVDSMLAFSVGDSGTIYRYNGGPTGIRPELQAASPLSVFPSPATHDASVTIMLPGTGFPARIDFFDAAGKCVYTFTAQQQEIHLPTAIFAGVSGRYLVRCTQEGKVSTAGITIR